MGRSGEAGESKREPWMRSDRLSIVPMTPLRVLGLDILLLSSYSHPLPNTPCRLFPLQTQPYLPSRAPPVQSQAPDSADPPQLGIANREWYHIACGFKQRRHHFLTFPVSYMVLGSILDSILLDPCRRAMTLSPSRPTAMLQ
jgi:hypothetical protein